jgi:hypothetical protein
MYIRKSKKRLNFKIIHQFFRLNLVEIIANIKKDLPNGEKKFIEMSFLGLFSVLQINTFMF